MSRDSTLGCVEERKKANMSSLPAILANASPVFVAPMAGGPSTPDLVTAAARSGHIAQLAAGYRTAEGMSEQTRTVRSNGTELFGVNVFVPNPSPIDPDAYRRYAETLLPTAERFAVPGLPSILEDDDEWEAKIGVLVNDPVPIVSFTFGLPEAAVVRRLRAAGSVTMQTVTSSGEAQLASALGIDVLVVQSAAAGGHSAILDPTRVPVNRSLPDLIRDVRSAVDLPLIATGGVTDAHDVRTALEAGAAAVAVGTAVLRSPESGASSLHKDALANPTYNHTVLTRAFTGRPARALANQFVIDHDADAPAGYPALHHLTKPIRTAATAAGDPSAVNLWAGTGWKHATTAPAAQTLAALADY